MAIIHLQTKDYYNMNFTDNPNFYPTPVEVIKKMLAPWLIPESVDEENEIEYRIRRREYRSRFDNTTLNNKLILEPSAGKGDIVDFIVAESRVKECDISVIEPDLDLISILQDKNYNIISKDFLEYDGNLYFDLIVMNPPFDRGDEHLLKAWSILKEGDIVCLLNAETLRNPYTKTRQLLCQIIGDNNGSIEYLGDCFSTAERKTDVQVAMVRLTKKDTVKAFEFKFTDKRAFDTAPDIDPSIFENQLAFTDTITNLQAQMKAALAQYELFRQAYHGFKFYADAFIASTYTSAEEILKDLRGDEREKFNNLSKLLNSNAWRITLANFDFQQYMTSDVYNGFEKFMNTNAQLEFTRRNVSDLVETLFLNRFSILEKSIVQVFDYFTSYHKENRLHVEGWKTNDYWKVNRKVILPSVLSWDTSYMDKEDIRNRGANLKLHSNDGDRFTDIDKAMCYITGTDYKKCWTLREGLHNKFNCIGRVKTGQDFDNTGESEFFTYKFWKKGTIHLYFKDEKLWQEFNMRACADKNWLPEAERKAWQASKTEESPIQKQLLLT